MGELLYPERQAVLEDTVIPELISAAALRPWDFRRTAPGTATRYGPGRQRDLAIKLYNTMLRDGTRIGNVQDIARALGISRKEAASMLAVPGGPDHDLDPMSTAMIKGSVRTVERWAPVPGQVVVIAAPNSPTPGMHKTKRVFGVGPDGHQRLTTAYLTSVYGPDDALGYSVALDAWVRRSSLDDEQSAAAAGRLLALEHPTRYAGLFSKKVLDVVDGTLPGRRLPVVLLDGRRDQSPAGGIAIDSRVESPVMQPHWERDLRATIGDHRTLLAEASDPARAGGGGLPAHMTYQTSGESSERLTAAQFEAGLRGEDPRAANLIGREWQWLPALRDGDEDSTSVMAFDGTMIDRRTGGRSRVFVMISSATGLLVFMLMPFEGPGASRDPLPDLALARAHLMTKADVSRVARVCVGPSRWVGTCRRAAMTEGRAFFDVASRDCATRELAFAIGSHFRLANLSFPTEADPTY
jgi:hypothetical protein